MSNVNNGRRAEVEFATYRGPAGLVEHAGIITIAFFSDFRALGGVSAGTIDGVPYRVISATRSDPAMGGVKGMVRLVVECTIPPVIPSD